ncbi:MULTISPECIES: FtsX-like permease family protein [unclassified Streptomyces]|uniref:ABC transporter permease n=1 Tax=unclassified Streptomyces TaxID=2593676 RepID=UPI002E7FE796|nr:FtsX-like permease family protein [Streptomyces sp. NBC_00589]WTI41123.1 FtsX-like permease family protein [Streptomyces sp. NBC_00775]WUB25193.1 FtsX-like permease family protein [Streptomyces sp. NBC_00589]
MTALGRVVRSGVGRRRVQSLVIGLTMMMAVTASVLGGSLLVASSAPFDHAFGHEHGAHLSVQFDASRATAAQLSASADAARVAEASGPFRTATVTPHTDEGIDGVPMTVVGRSGPGAGVDQVALTEGRWAGRPGEIVISDGSQPFPSMGRRLTFPGLPGSPTLKVVGLARSASRTGDAWVVPSQIAALTPKGRAGGYEMLYRLTTADTAAQVAAGRRAVTAAVPAGSVTGAQSWLTVKKAADRETALFVPFLLAFGILGLVMSVLIVGNVVAGTVGAGLRRIGILKAVGFTPPQVVRAYVGQALIPAAIGTALGVVAGHLAAVPVLSETANAYSTGGSAVEPWVDAAVIAGALGLVTVTAWAAAWRVGRLRTVDALAVGRTPSAGRGRWAAGLGARLPVSRPVGLGLARPFARPARASVMCATVVFGAVAVTFAVGLASSLGEVMTAREHNAADVTIGVSGPQGPVRPATERQVTADPAAIVAAINSQPGTGKYYGIATTQATVSGAAGSLSVFAFTGDASWGGYEMVSGRWFATSGEAVVPTPFLTATGTKVGDTVVLNDHGSAVTVRIVGEVLDTHNQGMEVFTERATLTAAEPGLRVESHHIAVKAGTDVPAYIHKLNAQLRPLGVTAEARRTADGSGTVAILDALTAMLTLMLVSVAGLGVLNGVVLDTRERVRDLGIHKALGMTPRQTVVMVVTSVVVTGLVGGALGVPLGVALHGWVMPAMGHSAGLNLPDSVIAVYRTPELVLLALGGLFIAVLGALLPAGWAARTRTATALRTE